MDVRFEEILKPCNICWESPNDITNKRDKLMADTYKNAEDEDSSSHESSWMFPDEYVRTGRAITDEEDQESMPEDNQARNYYPTLRRSTRQTRPPERFYVLLVKHCLLGRTDDPLSVFDALSADDSQ